MTLFLARFRTMYTPLTPNHNVTRHWYLEVNYYNLLDWTYYD